jgi:cytochrome c-type biogenesis protein CcmH
MMMFVLLFSDSGHAQDPLEFDNPQQADRFNALTSELRCLVCQNQTLADSDAALAQDLRREVYDMIQEGKSDQEIKTFLVERYGDFVLYRPPLGENTLLLWFMPLLLLVAGGAVLFFLIKRQQSARAGIENAGEQDAGEEGAGS